MNQLYLYEWEWKKLPDGINAKEFIHYLSDIWQSRKYLFNQYNNDEQTEEEESDIKRFKQGFLRFDGDYISAKNYIGFIQYNGVAINVLPKVFARTYPQPSSNMQDITSSLLNWLRYSTKIRFPFSEVSFEQQRFDHLLEPFIFIFAEYTNRLLEKLPYQCFEEVIEQTAFLKGRLATRQYINESLVTGNSQNIVSNYEVFEFNNRFNQVIKSVVRLLINHTANDFSYRKLQNIIFMLDNVDDKFCTEKDCDRVHFSRIYDDWNVVLNMCRMFLTGQSFKNQYEGKSNFCFLVPMELIFEEYVAGILDTYSGQKIIRQSRAKYLTNENVFQVKPDIILDNSIIIDTKYKILDKYSGDGKLGVSQNDLYQMLAYAIRHGINKIKLIYPDDSPGLKCLHRLKQFTIEDELTKQRVFIEISTIDILTSGNEKELVPEIIKKDFGI